jgi:hypothetical protein
MSERLPAAIRRLVPDVTDASDGPTVASFLRGLAMGALVGAAIAGSALLQRRRASHEREAGLAAERIAPPDSPIPGE